MSDNSSKSIRGLLIVLALGLFGAATWLSLHLLYDGKITGGEFVALVVAYTVICLLAGYGPEIQEFSIAGNVVKLKEVKADALRTIESLKETRVETLRVLLGLGLNGGGVMGARNQIQTLQNLQFWHVVSLIRKYSCLKELKTDLLEGVEHLLKCSLSYPNIYRSQNIIFDGLPLPIDYVSALCSAEAKNDILNHRDEQSWECARAVSEEYCKLYDFKQEILHL